MAGKLVLLLTLLPFTSAGADSLTTDSVANPVRKVVSMLQMMQKRVTEEGVKEEAAFDKYMCWCKNGGGDLEKTIAASTTKVPAVQSDIEVAEAQLVQTKEDLASHAADRDAAKKAIAEATSLRNKEAAAFAAQKSDLETNINAIAKAVAALEKGMGGAFLQSPAATVLRNLLAKQEKFASEGSELVAFLSETADAQYVPSSGQVTGILKTMHDEMSADLADATAAENTSIQQFESLMSAKNKEVAALTKMTEDKLQRQGELSVRIAEMKNDLTDTEEALIADKGFLANLDKSCETKKKEWAERSATRADELVALAETIKVLNDDDALELFKKALPTPSFAQVASTTESQKARALKLLSAVQSGAPGSQQMGFVALALKGKKIGFDKIIVMIDNLVVTLKAEQTTDDDKKAYCAKEFDTSDDQKKGLERSVSDAETSIADTEERLAALKESIAALSAGISALDKSVAEATAQRKQEHIEFNDLIAQNSAAKDVLNFAKNRLNKFYNPALHKAAPKRVLSEEERITVNMGGTLAPTAAPGGIAGTGIALAEVSLHNQGEAAPPPPPATFGAYAKKSGESGGVIEMINLLIKDLDKDMTEGKTDETDAQSDYEVLMTDSANKRAQDSKSLSEQEGAKADAEAALQDHNDNKKSTENELNAKNKYISSLHGECDWLLKFFEVRKEARAGEVDSLGRAKAVLSGSDYA